MRPHLPPPPAPKPQAQINWGTRAREGYASFRLALIRRIFDEQLKPIEVATILGEAADQHPEIRYEECRDLRAMGEHWLPWNPAVAQP